MESKWRENIESTPEVLRGKPRLKGTRIPVSLILGYLASGYTPEGIIALQIKNHPEVIPHIISQLIECLLRHPDPGYFKGKLFLVEAHRIRVR